MKITGLTYQTFSFPLLADFINSKQKIRNKEVIIIIAKDELNNFHYGEISPLAGFSKETISGCKSQMDNLISRKILLGNDEQIKNKLNQIKIHNAVKFGIEQVLLSVELKYNSARYKDKFNFSSVELNGIIGIKNLVETVKNFEELVNKNFKTIKFKIGRNSFNEDLEIVKTITEKFSDKVKIRLDVNGKWTFDEAREKLKILSRYDIEFIEQPVKEIDNLIKLANEYGKIVVPDECIENYDDLTKILDSGLFKFIILKPAIRIGIFDTLRIISAAESRKIKVIITSSFETIIGRSALVFLASITNHSFAHGLATELLGTDIIKGELDVDKPELFFSINSYPKTFKIHQ